MKLNVEITVEHKYVEELKNILKELGIHYRVLKTYTSETYCDRQDRSYVYDYNLPERFIFSTGKLDDIYWLLGNGFKVTAQKQV
jgi:hypothetical protein